MHRRPVPAVLLRLPGAVPGRVYPGRVLEEGPPVPDDCPRTAKVATFGNFGLF